MLPPLKDPLTLTREELYEQVWSEPMWTLAERFGLSDVGLAKACRRHQIPVPGRGYWRQKEVGQAVRRARLPKLSATMAARLGEITFQFPHARQAARENEPERQVLEPVVVPETLADPHPLVVHTIKALRRVKPTREGVLPRSDAGEYLDVRVTLETVDRAMRVLDTLLKALDERGVSIGVTVHAGVSQTTAHILGQDVPFHIEERMENAPAEPTPTPRRDSWTPPVVPRKVGSGALEFHIDVGYIDEKVGRIRKSWRDGKQQRVEDSLAEIIIGLTRAAQAVKDTEAIREEWQREWKEQERRDKYRRWEALQEKRRRESLDAELQRWGLLRDIRHYLEIRRSRGAPDGVEPARWGAWLQWVADYADRLESRLDMATGPSAEPFNEDAYYP